jgi:hypothetical protein
MLAFRCDLSPCASDSRLPSKPHLFANRALNRSSVRGLREELSKSKSCRELRRRSTLKPRFSFDGAGKSTELTSPGGRRHYKVETAGVVT